MLKPLSDIVLIKRATEEKPGVYIPEQFREKPNEGVVLAKGPLANDVLVGDRVFFSKYAGVSHGDNQVLIREAEILFSYSDQ